MNLATDDNGLTMMTDATGNAIYGNGNHAADGTTSSNSMDLEVQPGEFEQSANVNDIGTTQEDATYPLVNERQSPEDLTQRLTGTQSLHEDSQELVPDMNHQIEDLSIMEHANDQAADVMELRRVDLYPLETANEIDNDDTSSNFELRDDSDDETYLGDSDDESYLDDIDNISVHDRGITDDEEGEEQIDDSDNFENNQNVTGETCPSIMYR